MSQKVTLNIGNLAVIDKVDGLRDGYCERVLGKIGGETRDFIPKIRMLIYNKLGPSLSVNRLSSYPDELFKTLGFRKPA